jgi:integrase
LGPYDSRESKVAYARFLADLPKPEEAPAPVPEPVLSSPLLVGEVVLRYFEFAKSYYAHSDGTATGEHITIRNMLRPLAKMFGDLPAAQLGPKKLKLLQAQMAKSPKWCRGTVNRATAIVKRCFRWAASEELIPASVVTGLATVGGLAKGRTAAREKAPVRAVPDHVVEATLMHVSDLVADVVKIMRLTGARPSEALNMRVEELDRSDSGCWVYRPGRHKGSHLERARAIHIGPRAQVILLPRILKAGAHGRLFEMNRYSLRTGIHRGTRRAFPHPTLSGIPSQKLTDEQRAELRTWQQAHSWHPNRLRHSAATEARAKFGLEASQVMLGHSRADVTQVYAERDLSQAAKVARAIG